MAKADPFNRARNDTLAFTEWCIEHYPETVAAYCEFTDKANRLAELEATIAEAVEAANKLRGELGIALAPAKATANPKRTRKPRAAKSAEDAELTEPATELVESQAPLPRETVVEQPEAAPEPEVDDSDFEDFEIPPDSADDEF